MKDNALDPQSMLSNPFEQFRHWYEESKKFKCEEPAAVFLATASPDGAPSSRVVLLKDFDEKGFVFATNFTSQKGKQISDNPQVSLTFYWDQQSRQIHIRGSIEKV